MNVISVHELPLAVRLALFDRGRVEGHIHVEVGLGLVVREIRLVL